MGSKVAEEVFLASKQATQYFEKMDKNLFYHAGALMDSDWFLSGKKEEPGEATWLKGLAPPDNAEGHYVIAFPHSSASCKHTSNELHQLVRELVTGLYIFQQTPSIGLDGNHDGSMATSLPSAYVDTFLGQTLFSMDYFIKSLLHGSTVPLREKRARIIEKWRKVVSESPTKLPELYKEYGLISMEDDPELGSELYHERSEVHHRFPARLVDHTLSAAGLTPRLSSGEDQAVHNAHVSRDVFLRYLDQVSLGLMLGQRSVQQDGSLIFLDPLVTVFPCVTVSNLKKEEEDILPHLHAYLQKQSSFVQENLLKKSSMAHVVELLQFVSFIIVLLATLRQTHKTINCQSLQPPMNPDTLNTDREVPPFLPTPSSRWSPHISDHHYTSAHGKIAFHKGQVPVVALKPELRQAKEEILTKALNHPREASTVTVDGTSYTLVVIKLDDYYPKFPRWIHAMVQELKSQVIKLPPISDARIQDFLRRPLGLRHASKLKTIHSLLRPCIEKNLIGPLSVLLKRTTKTRLCKPDEDGLSLLHFAASRGQSEAVSLLIHYQANPHQPCPGTSTLPIHLAAQSGDLDTVCCLLQHGAQLSAADDKGWSPIHHAAFHNYSVIIRHLAFLDNDCVNLVAESDGNTPLLLAAENGGIDSVKILLHFGANISAMNRLGHNIIHKAASKHHCNILLYLVELNSPQLPLWESLAGMLKEDIASGLPHVSACALDSLMRARPSCYQPLYDTGAIKQLMELAKSQDERLQYLSVQVLADISHDKIMRETLAPSIPNLVKHLSSSNDRLQSCVCIALNDLAMDPENQEAISEGLPHLIAMLCSPHDDVQMYAASCLANTAMDNPKIQRAVRENGGLEPMIDLLSSPLMCTQGCAAASLEVLIKDCPESQIRALNSGIVEPVVLLLKSKAHSVHTNAARAIESLAKNCPQAQAVLQDENSLMLLRRLLKVRNSEVKVCSGCALWAIAGSQIKNRRLVANFMGIDTVVDLMTTPNDKLYYVCSEALGTLATELGSNQSKVVDLGGILPLVEILLSQTSEEVYISVLHTLGLLLTKPGLVPNTSLQKAIAETRGLTVLTALVVSPLSELLRVKAACTLSKLILNNPENESKLMQQDSFSHYSLLKLLSSTDLLVRLLAGEALSIFVFNSPKKLQMVEAHGRLNVSNFLSLLTSPDEVHRAHGAFQLIMLSKLLVGVDPAEGSIHGIKLLVQLAASQEERTKLDSCNFLACLARCKEGIPITAVMAGAITPLIDTLLSRNPPLEEVASTALGYYTYQPMGSRLIKSRFRTEPELFDIFSKYIKHVTVSRQFLDEWNYIEKVGLPSLSLEKRGGPAIGSGWKHSRASVPTTKSDFATQRALDRRPTMERILLHSSPSLPGDMANPRNSLLLQRKLNLFKETEEKKKRGGKDKVKKASIHVHGNL